MFGADIFQRFCRNLWGFRGSKYFMYGDPWGFCGSKHFTYL